MENRLFCQVKIKKEGLKTKWYRVKIRLQKLWISLRYLKQKICRPCLKKPPDHFYDPGDGSSSYYRKPGFYLAIPLYRFRFIPFGYFTL